MSRIIRRHGGGTLFAVIMAVLSLMVASLAVPQTATAVQTDGFTVSNIVVHSQPRNQNAKMTFDWSAENLGRAPQAGEGFELTLPPQLEVYSNSRTTQPLVYQGTNVGTCVFGASTIACTFDDGIANFADKNDVKGGVELDVVATNTHREAYTGTTIDFTFNGETVTGQIPTGIAEAPKANYNPASFSKYSTPIGEGQGFIPWVVDFNFTQLNAKYPGQVPVADGATDITITLKDTLGPGYDLANLENSAWALVETNNANAAVTTPIRLADTKGTGTDSRFTMTATGTGEERMITITGPFKPDTNYRLSVPSRLESGAVSGVEYTNSIEIVGTDIKATGKRSFINAAKVTIDMKDGYGGIRFMKVVSGSEATQVPANTEFTMKLNYTLPAGKTPSDYPDWTDTKSPEVTDGANTGTVTLKTTVGTWTNFPYQFPVGTTFTFEEELPTVPGVSFNKDRITFNPATATIADKQVSEVTVTNIAEQGGGTFKIVKKLNDAAPTAAKSKEFSFQVVCTKDNQEVVNKEVTITGAGETVVSDVPIGADCVVTEDTDAAKIDGYQLTATIKDEQFTQAADENVVEATNTYTELGRVVLTKEITGLAASSSENESREFDVEASWTDASGNQVTENLKISTDENTTLPELPAGTVITLKEILPTDGILSKWETPKFSSDTPGVVVDNGDGTATVTIPSDIDGELVLVTVTNSTKTPWWLLIVPFLPGAIVEIITKLSPQSPAPAPTNPATPAPTPAPTPADPGAKGVAKGSQTTPAATDANAPAKKGVAKSGETTAAGNANNQKAAGSRSLAQTGASVLGLLAVAALLVALGVFFVRRGRTNS